MKNRVCINFNYILSTWIKINSIIFTIIGIIGTFISIPDIVKTKHAVEIMFCILTVSLVTSVIYVLWFNNCITAYTTSQGKIFL